METLEAPLTTRPASEIAVKAFHHTLIWPLLMRGPAEAQPGGGQSIEGHVHALKAAGWRRLRKPDEVPLIQEYIYEEIVYFHPFVRDFLFGDGETKGKNRALRRFKRMHPDVTGVKIAINADDSDPLEFRVERCEILLLRPQVLILLVEVSNRKLEVNTADDPTVTGDEHTPLKLDQVLVLQSRFGIHSPLFFGLTQGDVLASVNWIGLKTGYEMTGDGSHPG